MPRKKGQGINLQKRTIVKSQISTTHIKKTLNFDKTKELKDCINESANKPASRVPEIIPVLPKTVEISNDNYLHKKFKKIAGISISTDKSAEAEIKPLQNGYANDAGKPAAAEPAFNHRESVQSAIARVTTRCNSLDVNNSSAGKNEGNGQDSDSPKGKRLSSPFPPEPPKQERTRSPSGFKKCELSGGNNGNSAKYTCPYCQLACAKPSVLQKHIRAHTNERPYPCSPCGFAFKTKSNLYKHCRSQAHRFKTQPENEKCDSGEETSDDSGSNHAECSPSHAEPEVVKIPSPAIAAPSTNPFAKPTKATGETKDSPGKIYKPKFHKAALYQNEKDANSWDVKVKTQEGIAEKQKKTEEEVISVENRMESKPVSGSLNAASKPVSIQSSIFANKTIPPSPEYLNEHIAKIISDNQAIVETMEPKWTKKFLQRQNSREKEVGSPMSPAVSSSVADPYQKYGSDVRRREENKSKLALALLKADKTDVVNYNHTYQPLNLTMPSSVNSRNHCQEREVTRVDAPYLSPGPLLGTTPLVDVKTEVGPPPKKRRTQSTSPDGGQVYGNRRLSTSSLPCSMSPSNGLTKHGGGRSSTSPSRTLKSLEELSKYPMKPMLNMFGGEVKILDCGETKTMRIESNPNPQSPVEASAKNSSKFFVTIAKTGLHSGGGTLVHVPVSTAQTNPFQMPNILNYPDTTKLLMPLMPNISTPNLAVPGVPTPNVNVPPQSFTEIAPSSSYKGPTTITVALTSTTTTTTTATATTQNGGILTIVHGGRQIPYVPGIPGPQTIFPAKITDNIVRKEDSAKNKSKEQSKSTVSSLIGVRKPSSSNLIKNVPNANEIPKIEISGPESEAAESKRDEGDGGGQEESGLKFLRPTSLPLRPGSFTPKRLHQGITPTVLSLVSPETPRPKKSYGQLFLNGHAYTYLGLKCSTKSYYCTISRPQPMYVVQSAQYPKLSMYSNWKVYSESEPSLLGLTPAKAMAYYDSRHRSSSYTIADKYKSSNSSGIVTHSSSWLKNADKQSLKDDSRNDPSENASWSAEPALKRVKIFAGGYESNEDYTYVRGRGRGRYVCEECGIRCKKPSMLKKHIRTHTDVRPYTCRYCTFSFKTKGNLTKHMKSKAHYKKCMELNIHPIPTTVEAENIDEELLVKQQAMKQDGNDESDYEDEDEEDESDGGDEEDGNPEDPDSLEREAACSLLSLSEMTTRSSQYKLLYVAAGLIPKGANGVRPYTYPYATTKRIAGESQLSGKEELHGTSAEEQTGLKAEGLKAYENDGPMDLSQKENKNEEMNFLLATKKSEHAGAESPKKLSEAVTTSPISTAANTVPPYLLASINGSTVQEQQDKLAADLSKSQMLQAYLTAKALRDVKMKQLQSAHRNVRTFTASRNGGEPEKQFDMVSQLHQNFCRIYEKSVENNCVNLKRFCGDKEDSAGVPSVSGGASFVEESAGSRVAVVVAETDSQGTAANEMGQRSNSTGGVDDIADRSTDIKDREEDRARSEEEEKSDKKEENKSNSSDKSSDKGDNVSVTLETSAGKMILVNIPTETDRGNGSLPAFLSKSGDSKLKAEFFPPSSGPSPSYVSVTEDGRSICVMCNKIFTKASQLKLHVNIHYFERPYRCEPCAVSFRTKGHLQKHERSGSHHNKVSMNTTFGAATTSNPRPFNCDDCKIAFRIHGHLAKHLRSKMHIMKLECIGKLPFGTYAEMERSGVNLNEIDTSDCENSLESLQILAQKLYGKDPTLVPVSK